MSLDDWILSLSEEDREALCAVDGWRAGAEAMLVQLKEDGLVDKNVYYDFYTIKAGR